MTLCPRQHRQAITHSETLHIETGLWCQTCRRATGNRITLATRAPGGEFRLRDRYRCYHCNGSSIEAP